MRSAPLAGPARCHEGFTDGTADESLFTALQSVILRTLIGSDNRLAAGLCGLVRLSKPMVCTPRTVTAREYTDTRCRRPLSTIGAFTTALSR
jgi:hypothetical protein